MQRTFLGIDGCSAGWCCIRCDRSGRLDWQILDCLADAVPLIEASRTSLIDIPIGLADGARACDVLARRHLGPRRTSVFPVPARATLAATSYAEALCVNRKHTGRGLSKQAWNIVPKIREVDALLQTHRELRGRLRESHPELAFAALNGGEPMRANKKTAAGRQERMQVLRRHHATVDDFVTEVLRQTRRKDVAVDDVLDALVLALMARRGDGHYCTLPDTPPRDATGLPMEMVFTG